MALWNVNGEIVYAEGALGISNPSSSMFVKRHLYTVPRSNIGIGAITTMNGKTYHVPSWTEVHPQTTINDIIVEEKPFAEIFEEPEQWTFESSSGDKIYKVKRNKNGKLSCDCWGYIAHRNCKHIKEVDKTINTGK